MIALRDEFLNEYELDSLWIPERLFAQEIEGELVRDEGYDATIFKSDYLPKAHSISLTIKRHFLTPSEAIGFANQVTSQAASARSFIFHGILFDIEHSYFTWQYGETMNHIEGTLTIIPSRTTGGVLSAQSISSTGGVSYSSGTVASTGTFLEAGGTYDEVATSIGAISIHNQTRDATYWYDETANSLDGTLVGAPVWNATGGPGAGVPGYFSFNGTDEYIDVGDQALLDFTGPFTMVWWQRTDGAAQVGNWNQIIGKGNSPGYQARHYSTEPRQMNFTSSDGNLVSSITGFLPDNEWVMFMARFTGYPGATELWWNNNGTAVLIDTLTSTQNPISQSSKFFFAAQDRTETAEAIRRWWRGDLAGALTFDAAISTTDFETLYDATDISTASAATYNDTALGLGAVLINNQSRDGTNWFDESGNTLHGTLTNAPTWSATGGPGTDVPGYFSFNGTNQIVEIANNALLQFTTAFSLVWWQRADGSAQSAYAQIIGKGNEGYQVRLENADQTAITSQVWDGSASYGDATTATGYLTPFVNTWKMFMFKYNGTDSHLYTIDGTGAAVQVLTDAYALGPEVNTTRFVYAAQDDYGSLRRYWRGDLAGGLAFGTALTPAEFESLYDATMGTGGPPDPGGAGGDGDFADGVHTYGLVGNESFNPVAPTLKDGTTFTPEMETYYNAFYYGFTNPSADSYNNIVTRLSTGDSYGMGRYGQVAQDPAMSAFRLTGDLRILDHLITAWNGAYSELTIEFESPMSGLDSACNPPTDPPWSPYRKWLEGSSGTDTVSLQEIKPRAINLEFVWALHQNVGKTSPAGHNYATELAKWKSVVEEYVKACAEDSTDCWVTGGNYRRVDGGFGYFTYRQRQSWGNWPIHLRGEGHSIYNSILAQHYLGLLGVNGVSWDIPNPADALTSAIDIDAYIDNTNRVADLDDYGRPKIVTKWTTLTSTTTAGVEALRATYTAYQMWSLTAMKLTGVFNNTLTDDVMLRLSRAYAEMHNTDGSTKANIAAYQDRVGHGLNVSFNTSPQGQIDNARKGYASALIWANESESGGTKLWNAATTAQNAAGGGYITPTSHALPAAQFIKRALTTIGSWNNNQATYYSQIVPPDNTADLFVDFDSGSDANTGESWAQAYATMEAAASDLNGVGGIVKVRGTRTLASDIAITSSGASPASRIEFWADGLYGAKVDANGSYYGIQLNSDYVELNGFEVYDANYIGIRVYQTGDYQTTGAFYNRIRYCYVHDLRWPDDDGGAGGACISAHGPYTEVDGCFISPGTPGGGDGFDTQLHGIYGRGSWLTITNNLVVGVRAGRGIQLYYSDTTKVIDCEVTNNTVLNCFDGGIQVQAENALIANNILAYNDGPGIRFYGTNSYGTVTHNLFHSNSTDVLDLSVNYTNTSVNGVSGDPGLVDYQANGTGNYKVTSLSPAYEAASDANAPAIDAFGNARTSTPTIGFYEVNPLT